MTRKKRDNKEVEYDADPNTFVNKKKHRSQGPNDDTPRAFKQLLRYQKISTERANERAQKKEKEPQQEKPKLKIKPGESMFEFSRRVNEAIPLPAAKGGVQNAKSLKVSTKQKKKAENLRREHHEMKVKRGRARDSDDEEPIEWKQRERSPDPWAVLEKKNVKPKFGEVADRPPELPKLKKLSNIPKSAGSEARREILEKERERVLELIKKQRGD